MGEPVVITGRGAVTPLGVGVDPLIGRWLAGESGVVDGEAPCGDFDPTDFISRKQARRTDRFTQLALAAADLALADAGWSADPPIDPGRIGCVIGTGIGGLGSLEAQKDVLRDAGPRQVSPLSVPLMMGNAAAAAVAMRHGLRGPSYGVVSACAAGSHAIGTAARMIRSGEAEIVVTGGAEATLTPLARASFAAMGALSELGISRPFDAERDGFVMGEGAGVLVLESVEGAAARGAPILGRVLGTASTSDAFHITAPDPEAKQAARAIDLALADAGASADDVDYVNAHGTSTELNDLSETEAVRSALGARARQIPISSTKSSIGHLLGAAGAVEAIATVEALRAGTAPPTVNLETPGEGLDLDYVPGAPKPMPGDVEGRVAISNSFGFGGHNAVLCLAA
jgi:3-oxoacyl-[acyl-carrier-protein] synthase II